MATLHHRPVSHSKKPHTAHTRSRPAPLKRTSAHRVPRAEVIKPAPAQNKEEEEDSMAVSFLQYCANCEKQIIVPSNSILYCSESCRRKDTNKSLPYPYDPPSPQTPFANFEFDDIPTHRDIVAPRSPTMPANRLSYGYMSDASESDSAYTSSHSRQNSEAARYLRQFQKHSEAMGDATPKTTKPRYNRSSTSIATLSNAPSLSHTPASTASMSVPFTPSSRPLPPRKNPHSHSYSLKSIDLVTPYVYPAPTTAPSSLKGYSLKCPASTSTATMGTAEGELQYEKRASIPSVPASQGSLKQLFAYDNMHAVSSSSTKPMPPPWS